MMKLLKYDLKRNAATFLSVGTILVLLQLIVSVVGNVRGWSQISILVLSLVLYSFTATLSVILVTITYRNNIKAYSRRLLPKRSIDTVLSVLILGWITGIVLLAIALLHGVIYNSFAGIVSADAIADIFNSFSDILIVLFQLFWAYTFLFVTIILSSTISASIKGKVGRWIGIVSFFTIQSVLAWVEMKLLKVSENGMGLVISRGTEVKISNVADGGQLTFDRSLLSIEWSSVALELVFIALILYATVLLLNRKEQV